MREPSMSTRYSAADETPSRRRASATIWSPTRCGGTLLSTSTTLKEVGPPASSPAARSASRSLVSASSRAWRSAAATRFCREPKCR